MTAIDSRALRDAFGTFMTGVTVVATRHEEERPRGFTANSFTSVSIEPPVLLVCLSRTSGGLETFADARGFSVNVLAEHQIDVARAFAAAVPDRFATVAWRDGPAGNPIFNEVAAWFDCHRRETIDAGDHVILLGDIQAFESSDANGLGFARGGYFTPSLEQDAIAAAVGGARLAVGAIVERDDAVFLVADKKTGGLRPPVVGLEGRAGSIESLARLLDDHGLDVTLGSLYSVYNNEQTGVQSIYYHAAGGSRQPSRGQFYPIDDLPFERFPTTGLHLMMSRFAEEHRTQRFGVYFDSSA